MLTTKQIKKINRLAELNAQIEALKPIQDEIKKLKDELKNELGVGEFGTNKASIKIIKTKDSKKVDEKKLEQYYLAVFQDKKIWKITEGTLKLSSIEFNKTKTVKL